MNKTNRAFEGGSGTRAGRLLYRRSGKSVGAVSAYLLKYIWLHFWKIGILQYEMSLFTYKY
jgi:hypothetical protein